MKPFNYSDFRQMIVKDITDLFKQKDPSNIDTLDFLYQNTLIKT